MLAHGGSALGSALATGGVRQVAASIPTQAGRHALMTAYQVGFTSTFDHLMRIGAVVALVGSISCLFLVRQKDFVPSHGGGDWAKPEDASVPSGEGDDGSAWSAAAHAG